MARLNSIYGGSAETILGITIVVRSHFQPPFRSSQSQVTPPPLPVASRSQAPILKAIQVREGSFWFDLHEDLLLQIQDLQGNDQPLRVPNNLAQLVQKAVILGLENEQYPPALRPFSPSFRLPTLSLEPSGLSSGLSFITTYQSIGLATPCQPVFQTIVNLDGDIINKVQEQWVNNSEVIALAKAHFWLVDQLLSTLRNQPLLERVINWVSLAITVVPLVATTAYGLTNGHPPHQLLGNAIIGGSGSMLLGYWVKSYVRPWLFQQVPHLMPRILKRFL